MTADPNSVENKAGKLVLVDDEPLLLRAFTRLLRRSYPDTSVINSANMRIAEVIEAIREQLGPNLTLIMDGQYIGGEAKNIIDALSADLAHHAVRVIVMTGDSQAAINVSRAFPQVPALAKPVDIQVLLETIRTAVPFKL